MVASKASAIARFPEHIGPEQLECDVIVSPILASPPPSCTLCYLVFGCGQTPMGGHKQRRSSLLTLWDVSVYSLGAVVRQRGRKCEIEKNCSPPDWNAGIGEGDKHRELEQWLITICDSDSQGDSDTLFCCEDSCVNMVTYTCTVACTHTYKKKKKNR